MTETTSTTTTTKSTTASSSSNFFGGGKSFEKKEDPEVEDKNFKEEVVKRISEDKMRRENYFINSSR